MKSSKYGMYYLARRPALILILCGGALIATVGHALSMKGDADAQPVAAVGYAAHIDDEELNAQRKALYLNNQGQTDEALHVLDGLIRESRMDSTIINAHRLKGQVLFGQGMTGPAIDCWNTVLERYEDNPEVMRQNSGAIATTVRQLALAHQLRGHLDEADRVLGVVLEQPELGFHEDDVIDCSITRIRLSIRKGDLERAEQECDRLAAEHAEVLSGDRYTGVVDELRVSLAERTGDHEAVVAWLEQRWESRDNLSVEQRVNVGQRLLGAYRKSGDVEVASRFALELAAELEAHLAQAILDQDARREERLRASMNDSLSWVARIAWRSDHVFESMEAIRLLKHHAQTDEERLEAEDIESQMLQIINR
jgi:tetratricopeptide (TPR) repeat protein